MREWKCTIIQINWASTLVTPGLGPAIRVSLLKDQITLTRLSLKKMRPLTVYQLQSFKNERFRVCP